MSSQQKSLKMKIGGISMQLVSSSLFLTKAPYRPCADTLLLPEREQLVVLAEFASFKWKSSKDNRDLFVIEA